MKPTIMTTKSIWAYCRVSTTKLEQELSLEEQRAWAEMIAQQRGASLVLFSERASAKTITRRPECVRMISLLEGCKAAERPIALVATSFDRLSRDMTDTMLLARALRQAGVELYIRDRGVVGMSSFAEQAALVGQAMGGHAENDAKSARSRASWERRRREGKPTSNKVPYGLQLRNERDIPSPGSAEWVLRAFEMYNEGIGMHRIAQRLKAGAPSHRTVSSRIGPDGTPLVRERFPVWDAGRVRKLLAQERYRDVIVSSELFDSVASRISKIVRTRQVRGHEYPLSGAMRCSGCGRTLHGHATGGGPKRKRLASGEIKTYPAYRQVRYYQCHVCNYIVNANRIEKAFRDDVSHVTARPAAIEEWLGRAPSNRGRTSERAELRDLQARLSKLAVRRQRAWDMSLDAPDIVSADLPGQIRRINAEESEVRDRIVAIESTLSSDVVKVRSLAATKRLLQDFWPLYDAASYETKRDLALTVVEALGGLEVDRHGLTWPGRSLAIVESAASRQTRTSSVALR